MVNNDILIFVHAHKTGGTTLNRHIFRNFKKDEVLLLFYDKLKIDPFSSKYPDFLKLTKKYILSIPKAKRQKIKVIIGHFVPYGVHKLFDRPCRYISINRNPEKRILSFYNYFKTLYFNERKSERNKKVYHSFLLINNKIPSFKEWCLNKFDNKNGAIVPRSAYNYFKALGYFNETGNIKKDTKQILEKFDFVAITENLKEDILYIYGLLKINKFFIDQNISVKYTKRVSKDLSKIMKKRHRFDFELYGKAKKANKIFKKQNPQYYKIIKKIQRKRKILLPFTQIIFDFTESLHRLSAFLRTKSNYYSRVVDYLKRKNS